MTGSNAVERVQSAERTPVDDPTKVTILVAGQVNPSVKIVLPSHWVVMVVLGVAKAICVWVGHETVTALTVDGKEIVVTVGPVAVTVVTNGVLKTPDTVSPGEPGASHSSGGPRVTSGQGGRVSVRVVVPPSPSGSGTAIGGISTLGDTLSVEDVWPLVMLTFEYCRPSVVMGSIFNVMVVVVVKKVVMTCPPTMVVALRPYSTDVVYLPGDIVVAELSELVGNTRMQGAGQVTWESS